MLFFTLFLRIRKCICLMITEMHETQGSITCWALTDYPNTSRIIALPTEHFDVEVFKLRQIQLLYIIVL